MSESTLEREFRALYDPESQTATTCSFLRCPVDTIGLIAATAIKADCKNCRRYRLRLEKQNNPEYYEKWNISDETEQRRVTH